MPSTMDEMLDEALSLLERNNQEISLENVFKAAMALKQFYELKPDTESSTNVKTNATTLLESPETREIQ